MKIIITGGCGFVGHRLVDYFLRNTKHDIAIMDKMTYASSGLDRVRDIEAYDDKRVEFYSYDLTRKVSEGIYKELRNTSYIFHLAAESHVDNSIADPEPFIKSNVLGTMHILNFARRLPHLKGFCLFSSDEVFGPAPVGYFFKENDRYNATNPYAATKAAAEQLTNSYGHCYKLPVFIIHAMNIIGERQHPEKVVPLFIRKIMNDEEVSIHYDGKSIGSRFYIYAKDVVQGIHFLTNRFQPLEMYNIVGTEEVNNLQLAQMIAKAMGKNLNYKMVDSHIVRPGCDTRYALDGTKMKKLGWECTTTVEQAIEQIVKWSIKNPKWLYI